MRTDRPTKRKKMVLESLYSIVAVVAATYVVLFGFLKKINEWYYVTRLGKKQNTLPPGDMGWPFIGNLWSFFKAFNSQDPDTFVENLIRRLLAFLIIFLFSSLLISYLLPYACVCRDFSSNLQL